MAPSFSLLLFVALAILATLITVVKLVTSLRKRGGALGDLFAGRSNAALFQYGKIQSGRTGADEFHYIYYPAANKQPPSMLLFLPCATPLAFAIRREGAVERFFKRIGINRETQIGDRGFDDRYYIVTEQDDATRRHLYNSRRRSAVEQLFALGFTHLRVADDRIQAAISPFFAKAPLATETLQHAAEALEDLRHGLPPASHLAPQGFLLEPPPPPIDNPLHGPWTPSRMAAFSLTGLLIIGGTIALAAGVDQYPPLDSGEVFFGALGIALASLLAFAFLMVTLLRGRPDSHRDLLIALLFGLMGVPLTSYGATLILNGALDDAPPRPHDALVTDKYITHSKNSTSYHLQVLSWRHAWRTEHLTVNADVHEQLTPGQSRLSVTTKPGWLGYEWILDYHLHDRR